MAIEFTQYILPYGRKETVKTIRPEPIEAMARDIIAAGYKFEAEILTTGQVSVTIEPIGEEFNAAIRVTHNDERLLTAIDDMITQFHKEMKS